MIIHDGEREFLYTSVPLIHPTLKALKQNAAQRLLFLVDLTLELVQRPQTNLRKVI